MPHVPPPYQLKAVEFGLLSPEAVVPREWLYDLYVLAPATPADYLSFFRNFGASMEVDDNTFLGLVSAAYFRHVQDPLTVVTLLQKRFAPFWFVHQGFRTEFDALAEAVENKNRERANEICISLLSPFRFLGDNLMATMPDIAVA